MFIFMSYKTLQFLITQIKKTNGFKINFLLFNEKKIVSRRKLFYSRSAFVRVSNKNRYSHGFLKPFRSRLLNGKTAHGR